ncbi:DNA polymerase III subunit delta [uncultured Anaerococcus sp.]|uniref:DNA polymerase III subunit delta n=1 Tax=uncultured Anaerococcus sp. TaxID=293428 RepID=UPI0025FB3B63|nr:DNA polymerase III subunit delta [uncultured Anaerococcus sp.]
MKYVEFFKNFIGLKTKGIYLFDSMEEYLNTTIIEEADRLINIKDFNLIKIKGDTDFDTLKNSYETYPVMEDRKIIIWQNIDLSKEGVKSYKEILDKLAEDAKDFPSYASLLIFSDKKPFKGKFYKEIKKNGTVVEIDRLNNQELRSFIGRRFVKNNKKISNKYIDEIINRFSYLSYNSEIDLFEVVNSVDKIISNSSNEFITKEDINDQLDQVLNLNIFNLTDSVSAKKTREAMSTLFAMEKSGEDLFMVYHMLIRQFRILTTVKSLTRANYNDSFIMKVAKIGSFELKKAKANIRNFTLDELIETNERLMDMEIRSKSEAFDMKDELLKLIAYVGIK